MRPTKKNRKGKATSRLNCWVEAEVLDRVDALADSQGTSTGKTVEILLKQALGMSPDLFFKAVSSGTRRHLTNCLAVAKLAESYAKKAQDESIPGFAGDHLLKLLASTIRWQNQFIEEQPHEQHDHIST